jgi:hypothetical protein
MKKLIIFSLLFALFSCKDSQQTSSNIQVNQPEIVVNSKASVKSNIKSPNSNKVSSAVTSRAKEISKPTKSQKSFTKTTPSNSKPKTTGFGGNKNTTTSNSSSNRSKSSFGSSSSKSSSSRR